MRGVVCSLLYCAAVVLAGFNDDSSDKQPSDGLPAELLSNADTQVSYGGLTVYLDSTLYVNEMPGTDPGGNRFIASLALKSVQGTVPPKPAGESTIYVFEDGVLQWQSTDGASWRGPDDEQAIRKVFRRGPDSLRNRIVSVLLRFSYQDQVRYIKQENLHVGAAY
jgi:hypothetical protein